MNTPPSAPRDRITYNKPRCPSMEWTGWSTEFVVFPKKIAGRWHFLRRLDVRRCLYHNPFALFGYAFHHDYRLPAS